MLHVSPGTVKRDWRLAKAWLLRELHGGRGHEARRSRDMKKDGIADREVAP